MKKTILALATLVSFGAAADPISLDATNKSSFLIGGKIKEMCKVENYSPAERSLSLDLASQTAQTTASVGIWCNTGQGTAKTTYSSDNGGYLVNRDDPSKMIEYKIDISGGVASDVSLATDLMVNQVSGSGLEGNKQTRSVKVTPMVGGFEYAGVYRDRIRITVSPN
ncbi:hypothetical protein [Ferrimonas marina]|uniref:Spore coat protein U (SCPU) domain-containing protein n=1 Tax=Ferrimonas marina TaxID=299255 RepID=A0A1M5VIT5_9GAMM|nr:hypothetical protein [Ferrimonas marina]SHH75098.1 hypothetical protein SAMN02745129_2800 [Ferrimonas marina]